VCPTKYRHIVLDEHVDEALKQICDGIELWYDRIPFLEIGVDTDHVHFLIQSAPKYSPTKIGTTIKSITAKRIFVECPKVKKQL
jgi:REP element-mobilizing transposase RayT